MIPRTPPIAEPKTIPTRAGSKPFRPESPIASRAAATAHTTFRSSFRASLGETTLVGSKSLTSAATRTGNSDASNARMKSTPLRPASAASQDDATSFPIGVTAPSPVTTTLVMTLVYQSGDSGYSSRCGTTTRAGSPPSVTRRGNGDCHSSQTGARLLLLVALRRVPACRGVPRAGPPAQAKPRDVQALPRRPGGAPGPRRAVRDRTDADARRRRGPRGAGPPGGPARLPRHRALPRTLAAVTLVIGSAP